MKQLILVMLSSAEAEIEPKFSLGVPWLVRQILFAANYYIYVDLIEAENHLRSKEWLRVVFVKPGGISHDVRRGHTLSEEQQQTFVSYFDVAAGMVECAENGEKWSGKSVSVASTGKAKMLWSAVPLLSKGLLIYLLPWSHSWLY